MVAREKNELAQNAMCAHLTPSRAFSMSRLEQKQRRRRLGGFMVNHLLSRTLATTSGTAWKRVFSSSHCLLSGEVAANPASYVVEEALAAYLPANTSAEPAKSSGPGSSVVPLTSSFTFLSDILERAETKRSPTPHPQITTWPTKPLRAARTASKEFTSAQNLNDMP